LEYSTLWKRLGKTFSPRQQSKGNPMIYEYEVQTQGGSSFDNLEGIGDRLQGLLNGEDAASRMAAGWEVWQVNTLNDHNGVNGLVIVYRREKQ
jgi:hypothetical protein